MKKLLNSKKNIGIFLFIAGILILLIGFKVYKDINNNDNSDELEERELNVVVVDDNAKAITCNEAQIKGEFKTFFYEFDNNVISFEYLNCVSKGTYINGGRYFGNTDSAFSMSVTVVDEDKEGLEDSIPYENQLMDDDIMIQALYDDHDNYEIIEVIELIPDEGQDLEGDNFVEGTTVRDRVFAISKFDDKYLKFSFNLGNQRADDAFMAIVNHLISSIKVVDAAGEE